MQADFEIFDGVTGYNLGKNLGATLNQNGRIRGPGEGRFSTPQLRPYIIDKAVVTCQEAWQRIGNGRVPATTSYFRTRQELLQSSRPAIRRQRKWAKYF